MLSQEKMGKIKYKKELLSGSAKCKGLLEVLKLMLTSVQFYFSKHLQKKKIHIIYSSFSIVKAFTKDLCSLGG